ncbi:MAG: anthranilate synthase component I [Chitinivibrionales bacterium]
MITPSFEEVRELAKKGTVVPVCNTILADTETPVSVWLKLFPGKQYSFLLESVTGGDTVARYSFIGADPFLIFRARENSYQISGEMSERGTGNPLERLRGLMHSYKSVHVAGLPRFCGGAVGYCSYDSIRYWENIPDSNPREDDLDEIFYGFYRTIIAFDNREHHLLLIQNIFTDETDDLQEAYKSTVDYLRTLEDRMAVGLQSTKVSIGPPGPIGSNFERGAYESAVEKCKEYIKAGDIFQVVLSQRFSVDVDASPFDLYRILRTVNPSPYMFFLNCDTTAIIGASPEMLVRVEDGKIETRPIAGTRPRGKNEAEDERLAAELKADPKEIAEHVMLVDLGRNDIGRVSTFGTVRADDMMHIEKYSHVMHMVTDVHGYLHEDKDAFDALFSCFPAGTLSGAPKIRAMEIIDELEPVRRSVYGGALGYIDFAGNLDSCIVIRTIVYKDGKATVQAGAGIVADSVPAKEYEETVNKAGALFAAINRAREMLGE